MNYIHSFFLYKLPNGLGHWVGLTAGEAVLYTGICGPFRDAIPGSTREMGRLPLSWADQALMHSIKTIQKEMPFPEISESLSMNEKIKEVEWRMGIIKAHSLTLEIIKEHILRDYVGSFLVESTD